MSVGNVTQAVRFDQHNLTLILGNNLDQGGNGARNGTGKTTIINALCYALYGQAITDIRKDNLVNKTNFKNMLVTVEFKKNDHTYKVERGRKPNVFRFLVDDAEVNTVGTDEVQGEGKQTQEHIERILGLSCDMFRHIVALNTYTIPFLSLKANEQRDLIEQLLGITQLSEKAVLLKELARNSKDSIKEEDFRIKAHQESNLKIESSINDLIRRSGIWARSRKTDIEKMHAAITELENINIDVELLNHKELAVWREKESQLKRYNREMASHISARRKLETQLAELSTALATTEEHTCHACGQDLHDEQKTSMISDITRAIDTLKAELENEVDSLTALEKAISDLGELAQAPIVKYNDLDLAINHKTTIENLYRQLEDKLLEQDPYCDQIDHLRATALTEISWDKVNNLSKKLEHQEFLLKLLTNKDSFIRRKIIEQNLSYLNHRLGFYLEKLMLPHEVKFQSDLSVSITQLGQEFDFYNLSRGEMVRVILSMSWSFRDVFESLNHPINITILDEIIDSGMDPNGVENALSLLKIMSREQKKNIFLVSHRDELIGRLNTVLKVTKTSGFTEFEIDENLVEI